MNAPRPKVNANTLRVDAWICRSNTATLGRPASGPMYAHVPPPSRLAQTPSSAPTNTAFDAVGSIATVLNGMLTGGVTFVHIGDAARAFVLLNTCPGLPGVASSNPDNVTYATFGSLAANAMAVTARFGTPSLGSKSDHDAPP